MAGVKLWGYDSTNDVWIPIIVDTTGKLLVFDTTGQGLVYYGVVTAVPGANQFTIPTLAGLGAGKFAGATSPYRAFVLRDAAGASAAPQGETQAITAYVTATGVFTTAAFTAAVAAGDEILILHPRIAQIADATADIAAVHVHAQTLLDSSARQLFSMDFWSASQEEVQLTDVAAPGTDVSLPDITVADFPAGAVVVRAVLMFKFRVVDNTNVAANALQGAQSIQIRTDAPGAWTNALTFVDNLFTLAGSTREGGDVFIGAIDVAATVTGNDTYNTQWTASLVDTANLQFNDVQVGLRIWYSV